MFNWPVIQGQAAKLKIRVSACPLTGTEILAATVSTGLTDAALVSFSPTFDAAGPPDVWLSVTPSQTASLAPGPYVVNVKLASNSGEIAYGLLEVVAAPGNQPAYDVLATPAMVLMLNPELATDPAKVSALPMMLAKATETIRRYCNRVFTRRTYTEYLLPSLEGEVMLQEMPINRVIRASRKPVTAIEITADASVYQVAYTNFVVVDNPLPTPFNVSYTGLVLNGLTNGVSSATTIPFAGMATLNDLAAAVDAVSGWKATIEDASYGRWPVSELYCDGDSQGALGDGVQIKVFSEDVSTSRINLRTGLLRMPRSFGGLSPRWGPDYLAWGDYNGVEADEIVRVTYDAGFTKIPPVVQEAAVELAKTAFDRIETNYAVKKESTGYYSIELNDVISLSIPDPIRQDLSSFIIHRA